ncbi:MAG: endonuclease/exonuclease/phosphatase family protein [Bacteroidales bacterium]|nr:endonuclease/exonuclease/phosphatase family protein [Bacteroidales bacterium]
MNFKINFTIKILALALLVLFIESGCNFLNDSSKLKVLTYNIHHGEGMDTLIDLERIANVINSVSPDLVALQEVDIHASRSGDIDQLNKLAELCKMNAAFGKAMDWDGGEYGNAVLSKFPIQKQTTYPLPGEPRSALSTVIQLNNGTEIDFIAVHLDVEVEARKNSIQPLEEIIKENSCLPIIIAGDFNDVPDSEVLQSLKNKLICATPELFTYPSELPEEQIDYVLLSKNDKWKVLSAEVLNEKNASDHRPLFTILEISTKRTNKNN